VRGGHQRLAWLDERNGGPGAAYDLQVSWVDIDAKQEAAVIVLLNNETAQGEFDVDTLRDLLVSGELESAHAELDAITIENLFPDDDEIGKLFANVPETIEGVVAQMQDTKQRGATRRAENAGVQARNDTETYLVVVFATRAEKEAFLARAGLSVRERYITVDTLAAGAAVLAGSGEPLAALSPPYGPEAERAARDYGLVEHYDVGEHEVVAVEVSPDAVAVAHDVDEPRRREKRAARQ